jgi:hypothetical protein
MYELLERHTHLKLRLFDRDFSVAEFKEVLYQIEENNQSYEDHQEHKKLWNKFLHHKDPLKLKDEEVMKLDKLGWQPPDPTLFTMGRPTNLMIFDDCVENKELYRSDSKGVVAQFTIKHRHHHTSIWFMSQIFSSAVPKQIRSNLSFVVLFAQKNDSIRKQASLEFSSHVSAEDFAGMWAVATVDPHGFFLVDFEAPKELRYRAGFDRAFVR